METKLEKWQCWYAGMMRAKKMWFRKCREACRQRDDTARLLKRVYQQTIGDHLLQSIHDDEMVQVYLSAGLLREIAEICNLPVVSLEKREDVQTQPIPTT